jgi:hypothetical protein
VWKVLQAYKEVFIGLLAHIFNIGNEYRKKQSPAEVPMLNRTLPKEIVTVHAGTRTNPPMF